MRVVDTWRSRVKENWIPGVSENGQPEHERVEEISGRLHLTRVRFDHTDIVQY
jgi:hypothetical protein